MYPLRSISYTILNTVQVHYLSSRHDDPLFHMTLKLLYQAKSLKLKVSCLKWSQSWPLLTSGFIITALTILVAGWDLFRHTPWFVFNISETVRDRLMKCSDFY